MLRALEHQVLEEMRESGPPWRLVFRADVIPEVDGDNGASVVFVQQQLETIGQLVLCERNHHRTIVSGIVGRL